MAFYWNLEFIYLLNLFTLMITSLDTIPKRKPKSISSFILKTYELLNDHQNDSIVKWSPNGIGFVVVNESDFAKTILPKHFKHSNYSSFVRQLNMYNFHKIREHNGESYFHHQHFDRDNKSALSGIRRKPEKKKRKLLDDEEDFEEFVPSSSHHDKENQLTRPSDNHAPFSNQPSSRLITQQNQIPDFQSKSVIVDSKGKISTTKQLFSSQFTIKFENLPFDASSQKKIDQGMWQSQSENDDKISIKNDLEQRMVPFPTKEFMYPSKHNLFPFNGKGNWNFDIFF